MSRSRRRQLLTIGAAIGGLLLFTYAIRRAGVGEIADAVRRAGWGLVPILILAGLRFVVRAEAWRQCMPAGGRLSLGHAFTAFLAGDTVGNLTPLGLLASEPTKVFLTRHHLAPRESVSSLAIDNLIYATSILAVVAASVVVLLTTVPLPFAGQEIAVAGLVALVVAAVAGALVMRGSARRPEGEQPAWRARVAALRQAVREFSAGHPWRVARVFSLDLVFHALAILEAFIALRLLLGDRSPTLGQAVLFESLNRVVTVVFKFVPLRVGVDEAASGAMAPLLGVALSSGVALAIVRKVRNLFWAGVGLLLIGVHHARAARAMDPRESAPARRT